MTTPGHAISFSLFYVLLRIPSISSPSPPSLHFSRPFPVLQLILHYYPYLRCIVQSAPRHLRVKPPLGHTRNASRTTSVPDLPTATASAPLPCRIIEPAGLSHRSCADVARAPFYLKDGAFAVGLALFISLFFFPPFEPRFDLFLCYYYSFGLWIVLLELATVTCL
ncbi:hypothetical protein K505DRAFT_86547 [Melanomma pulvis-pyrius CBS 109.77]|uniref:Uncharacterized protein n=1 Tax=Melanomma pulvis-pyrius CBS 109.77 TaxID=1314802 RepID=A0A6A6X0S4_9PLEO|nr:hypothetical protein K505DRAFT_86547 [Melanomma pulvis-pyrius CBS 109.77]